MKKSTDKTRQGGGLSVPIAEDALAFLTTLAAEAGCTPEELAADIVQKHVARRIRQREKLIEPQSTAPLDAFLPEPASCSLEEAPGPEPDAEHLSFCKIRERQNRPSSYLDKMANQSR